MSCKRKARLAAIRAHNERHERELKERRADALFRYIWRLCGAKRKRSWRANALIALGAGLAYGSNVAPYYAAPEDMI